MTNLRQAAEVALKALESWQKTCLDLGRNSSELGKATNALDELRQALDHNPDTTKMIEPDLLNQTCCECGSSGGYALYCGHCWNKANEWVGLTAEDYSGMSIELANFASAVEAKLKKKNT